MNMGLIMLISGGVFGLVGLICLILGIKNIRADSYGYDEVNQGNQNTQKMQSNRPMQSQSQPQNNGNRPPNNGFSQVYGQPTQPFNQGMNNQRNNIFDNSNDNWLSDSSDSNDDWGSSDNSFGSDDSGFSDLSFDDVFSDSPRKSTPKSKSNNNYSRLDMDDVFGSDSNKRGVKPSMDIDLDEDLEEF